MASITVQYRGFLVTVQEEDWPDFIKKISSESQSTEQSTDTPSKPLNDKQSGDINETR